ncbi:branched-chain amino acid ABC transporter permease [Saccharopolyspora sp. K220]|uniref:branched-chain amino acid ABC transporter permease n=1 Tax=Saccharopolyspora soli TaxID=2926618 RepID=UPI001F56F072|nr:branched-chain amino acid ABC transporter permease [Saccharopolyspora soli]MCI2419546.1 branched-chain amino acid ABC transporter permease [Saccharopolyspora soli]
MNATGRRGLIVLLLIASLPFWFIQTNYILSVATLTLIFMTASLGWNVISGFGGQISFGHSIFFGIGAYTTAILQTRYHGNAYLGVLLGVVLAVVVAVLLEWVTMRLRGIYFSLATFALTLVFGILASHFADFTGGDVGITLPLLGNNPGALSFTNKLVYYYVALALASAAFVASWMVLRSRLGLQLRAIQADQDAARACGVRALRVKTTAIAYSAALASLAGSLYLQYVQFIDPNSAFGPTIATQIALIAFVGGAGQLWGPVIGAALLVPLQQLLNSQLSAYPAGFNLVVYAMVVLVVLWIEPRGLMSIRWARLWRARHRKRDTPQSHVEQRAASSRSRA